MPSKNTIKIMADDSYYHVYARGNNKQIIFKDNHDFEYFIYLIRRYLENTTEEQFNNNPKIYHYFGDKIELLAYCVMPNHFHLLIYQTEAPYLENYMRNIMTSYSMHFNRKYRQTGHVFDSRYKAALIDNEPYALHISRYIHLNPRYWRSYRYSSYQYYLNGEDFEWLEKTKILSHFKDIKEYENFVEDYEETKLSLKELKHFLAEK